MWAADDDVFSYIQAGLDQSQQTHFTQVLPYLRLMCNFYCFSLYYVKCHFSIKCNIPVIIILGTVVVHLLVEVHGRYHYPLISLFALLSGIGLCKIESIQWFKKQILKCAEGQVQGNKEMENRL
jgi:hypothetical protein